MFDKTFLLMKESVAVACIVVSILSYNRQVQGYKKKTNKSSDLMNLMSIQEAQPAMLVLGKPSVCKRIGTDIKSSLRT